MAWRVSNNLFVPGTLNSIHVQLSTATFLVSYVEIVQETAYYEWEKAKEVNITHLVVSMSCFCSSTYDFLLHVLIGEETTKSTRRIR